MSSVTGIWAATVGDPAVPGSGSVEFLGTDVELTPGAKGLTGQVSQTPTFVVKPGDQYTLGIHGLAQVQGVIPSGVALFFFLNLNVTYLDGSSNSAAAGGSFNSYGNWQSGTNQLIVDATKTPTGITATVGAYWQNLTDQSISFLESPGDGWQVYLTAAGVVKTPQGFGVLASPLGLRTIPTNLVLGNGFDLQAAQVTQGNDADTLAFYAQSTPVAGTPIRFQSWQTQAAVSRLQDEASIQFEQYIVGDDGERSAIVSDLSPLPRTSEDCDNAALAFLADRTRPYYNGTYICTSLFFSGYYINPTDFLRGFADAEQLVGAQNGSNPDFTTQTVPTSPLFLVVSGVLQQAGIDYTVDSSGNVTFDSDSIPSSSDWMLAWYRWGLPQSANFVDETPSGATDGTNTVFTLTDAPDGNSLILFVNGVVEQNGVAFTVSGNTITYLNPPPGPDDWLFASYRSATLGILNFRDAQVPSGSMDGSNSVFGLPDSPNPPESLFLALNGVVQSPVDDFILDGNTFTYRHATPNSAEGDWHLCWYRY